MLHPPICSLSNFTNSETCGQCFKGILTQVS